MVRTLKEDMVRRLSQTRDGEYLMRWLMMFRLTFNLPPSEEGGKIEVSTEYKTFEEIIHKVMSALQVMWNSPLHTPLDFHINKIPDGEPKAHFNFAGTQRELSMEEGESMADKVFSEAMMFAQERHFETALRENELVENLKKFLREVGK
jgi:hypothetical protein